MISFVKSLVLLIWSSLETVVAFLIISAINLTYSLRKVHRRVTEMFYYKYNNTCSLTPPPREGTFFTN